MFGLWVRSRERCAAGKLKDYRVSSPEVTFCSASAAPRACARAFTNTSAGPERLNPKRTAS